MMRSFFDMIRDNSGAAMPEYALLLGLIGAVAVTMLSAMGSNINAIFSGVNDKLSAAAPK